MSRKITCRGKQIDMTEKTWIMGILNVTPDSFSDGGKYNEVEQAVKRAKQMVHEGADIIDIGGESTRPGFTPVSAEEEIRRVVPIIKAVREAVDAYISIDTFKSETAEQALLNGADIVNDVWGGKYDGQMAKVVATYQCPIILMHRRLEDGYKELIHDMKNDLIDSIEIMKRAGVREDQIILDPGIGFQKTKQENLRVLQELKAFESLPYPLLLGTSRKSVIGYVTGLPIEQRDEATAATTVHGILNGVAIVRVHNVLLNKRVAEMTDALKKGR